MSCTDLQLQEGRIWGPYELRRKTGYLQLESGSQTLLEEMP